MTTHLFSPKILVLWFDWTRSKIVWQFFVWVQKIKLRKIRASKKFNRSTKTLLDESSTMTSSTKKRSHFCHLGSGVFIFLDFFKRWENGVKSKNYELRKRIGGAVRFYQLLLIFLLFGLFSRFSLSFLSSLCFLGWFQVNFSLFRFGCLGGSLFYFFLAENCVEFQEIVLFLWFYFFPLWDNFVFFLFLGLVLFFFLVCFYLSCAKDPLFLCFLDCFCFYFFLKLLYLGLFSFNFVFSFSCFFCLFLLFFLFLSLFISKHKIPFNNSQKQFSFSTKPKKWEIVRERKVWAWRTKRSLEKLTNQLRKIENILNMKLRFCCWVLVNLGSLRLFFFFFFWFFFLGFCVCVFFFFFVFYFYFRFFFVCSICFFLEFGFVFLVFGFFFGIFFNGQIFDFCFLFLLLCFFVTVSFSFFFFLFLIFFFRIVKQMRILFDQGFTEDDRQTYKEIISSNVILSMRSLVMGLQVLFFFLCSLSSNFLSLSHTTHKNKQKSFLPKTNQIKSNQIKSNQIKSK